MLYCVIALDGARLQCITTVIDLELGIFCAGLS